MSTKSTISINYVDRAGKKGQKSITDINPAASGEQLQEFAEKLNALTTNSYGNTNRVDKTPITDAAFPGETTPTIVCYRVYGGTNHTATTDEGIEPTASPSELKGKTPVILKTDTDAIPYIVSQPDDAAAELVKLTSNSPQTGFNDSGLFSWRTDLVYGIHVFIHGSETAAPGQYVIGFPATENFKAATYTITVTAN